ncbi:TetR/AcrR family transcriptional regulator [Pedobacter nototheniae]|uniref:TetR/AcrR family transcriptional regulator n=1 Tax=Pedobacter nototheniae TaxID=2488994 RepID=UPI0029305E14|nr:TetR/AcrR family transcriptional regulator [Pedobacter nototheniae]
MSRKITDGPVRNKERTKKKILDSLGEILKNDGFTDLSLSKVATKANVDRRLIYDYFGGFDGMIKEYLSSRDYWKTSPDDVAAIVESSKEDHGKHMAYTLVEKQFDALMENPEIRQIINWGLSENSIPLKELNLQREHLGEEFFTQITDGHFKGKDKNIRAIEAILVSSVYYLTLNANMNESTMCGIDVNQKEGEEEIKRTIKQIIDWAYS